MCFCKREFKSCSKGQEGALQMPGASTCISPHTPPATQALHVHTRGWEHFQPKSAQLLDYFSPGTASAASSGS